MSIKRKVIFKAGIILTACFVILLLIDGYVLSELNYERLIRCHCPLLTWDIPHDGMGTWHHGVTYVLEWRHMGNRKYSVSWKSKINLPFRNNSSEEEVKKQQLGSGSAKVAPRLSEEKVLKMADDFVAKKMAGYKNLDIDYTRTDPLNSMVRDGTSCIWVNQINPGITCKSLSMTQRVNLSLCWESE
ncbi:MAG: hypothetical protein ABFR90_06995 [Planctomycetota bacterium]